jgi:predicted DNA-binding protein
MKIIEINNPILRKPMLTTMEHMGADKDLLKKAETGELTKEELKVWFDEQRRRIREIDRRKGEVIEAIPKIMNFFFAEIQLKRLNAIAEKTGLAVSEIVRRAIDDYWEEFERKSKALGKRQGKEVKRGKAKQSKKKGVV